MVVSRVGPPIVKSSKYVAKKMGPPLKKTSRYLVSAARPYAERYDSQNFTMLFHE
jgi:hypothetical protein